MKRLLISALVVLSLASCTISSSCKAVYIAKDGSTIVEEHYSKGGALQPTLKAGKVYIFSHFVK